MVTRLGESNEATQALLIVDIPPVQCIASKAFRPRPPSA